MEPTADKNEHLLGCSERQHPIYTSEAAATVAIVDDCKDTLEILEIMLSGQHQFVTFADPQEFLRTFRAGEYRLGVAGYRHAWVRWL